MKIKITNLFDRNLKLLIKNASVLLSGNIVSNILGVITLVIVARAIGPSDLGILALVQTYIVLVAALLLPKPWITIVKYGTTFLENKKAHYFKSLIKYGIILELLCSIFAFIITYLLIHVFFSNNEYTQSILIYSILLLFSISGTSTGVLRLFNKFNVLSLITITTAFTKLVMVIILWYFNKSLEYFILSYLIADILNHILLFISSISLIDKKQLRVKAVPIKKLISSSPGIVNFSISNHLNDILGTARRNLDFIIVGLLLSTNMVGFYKVIKQFGRVFSLLSNPIKQTLYPECCKLWERKSFAEFKSFLIKVSVLMLILFIVPITVSVFFINDILGILLGSEYIFIGYSLIIYLLVHSVFLSFQTLNSALLAMGQANRVLYIELITNGTYFLLIFILAPIMLLNGVIFAFGGSVIVWIISNLIFVKKRFNKESNLLNLKGV